MSLPRVTPQANLLTSAPKGFAILTEATELMNLAQEGGGSVSEVKFNDVTQRFLQCIPHKVC